MRESRVPSGLPHHHLQRIIAAPVLGGLALNPEIITRSLSEI
jgi:hypothetical protein